MEFLLLIWGISSFIRYTFSYNLPSQDWCNCVPKILTFFICIFSSVCRGEGLNFPQDFLFGLCFIRRALFNFQIFGFFSCSLYVLTSSLSPLWLENIFWIISVLLNLMRFANGSGYDLYVPWAFEMDVHSVVGWNAV